MQNTGKNVIGICDDQEHFIQQLKNMIKEICEKHNINYDVHSYLLSKDMLKHISELSIVFLDIEMPEIDGIELGKRIKENNSECKIIMATGMVERFKEAFQIQAIRFVTKPFDREEVEEALLAALGNDLGEQLIEVYLRRNKYMIQQAEIYYIEAFNGYVEIVVGDKTFRRDVSLDEMEQSLDEKLFVRISRKHLVNLRYIDLYEATFVKVKDKELSVSRRKKKEFEHKYIEFDLRYRRMFV